MTPDIVTFTELEEFDPRTLWRQRSQPIPLNWTRFQYEIKNYQGDEPSWSVNNWLAENLHGCWIFNYYMDYHSLLGVNLIVVIGFEKDVDAIMFRMLDGETKSLEHALERG